MPVAVGRLARLRARCWPGQPGRTLRTTIAGGARLPALLAGAAGCSPTTTSPATSPRAVGCGVLLDAAARTARASPSIPRWSRSWRRCAAATRCGTPTAARPPGAARPTRPGGCSDLGQLRAAHDGYRLLFGSPDVAALVHDAADRRAGGRRGRGAAGWRPPRTCRCSCCPAGGAADAATLRGRRGARARRPSLLSDSADPAAPARCCGAATAPPSSPTAARRAGGGPGPDPQRARRSTSGSARSPTSWVQTTRRRRGTTPRPGAPRPHQQAQAASTAAVDAAVDRGGPRCSDAARPHPGPLGRRAALPRLAARRPS